MTEHPGQRTNMCNAAPHLTCADNADFLNFRHSTSPTLDYFGIPRENPPTTANNAGTVFHPGDWVERENPKVSFAAILSRNAKFRK